MLELARERSAGAHPYLVTPEHTARSRAILGDALLAVEQGVVLEADPERARSIARQTLAGYATLPNYTRNWKRLGFTDEDVERLSERLVDAVVAWGDVDAIAARVDEHRSAGADHVCIQVLDEPGSPMNRAAWRALAPALVD
jgi:probable F420-dependent oxidoreductase